MSQPPPLRGFILQPTYRIQSGKPVVNLFGRIDDGRSFLVRDSRQTPHFYVGDSDAQRARERGAGRQASTTLTSLAGAPVVRVEVPVPGDTPPIRERLSRAGMSTFEADVRFAMRPLIDRGIRGSLEIRGEGVERPGVGIVFENPEITPGDWTPSPTVLSFDIETDPKAQRLLSIAFHGCGVSEVHLLTPGAGAVPKTPRPSPTRRSS